MFECHWYMPRCYDVIEKEILRDDLKYFERYWIKGTGGRIAWWGSLQNLNYVGKLGEKMGKSLMWTVGVGLGLNVSIKKKFTIFLAVKKDRAEEACPLIIGWVAF